MKLIVKIKTQNYPNIDIDRFSEILLHALAEIPNVIMSSSLCLLQIKFRICLKCSHACAYKYSMPHKLLMCDCKYVFVCLFNNLQTFFV